MGREALAGWSRRAVVAGGVLGAAAVAGGAGWAVLKATGQRSAVMPPPAGLISSTTVPRPAPPRSGAPVPADRRASRVGAGRWSVGQTPFRFRYEEFDVAEVPPGRRIGALTEPTPLADTGAHDRSGIRMYGYGARLFDHPVAQAQYGCVLLDSYRLTGDTRYLTRARRHGQRLLERRVVRQGGWFYPYAYEMRMHSGYGVFTAPWYSMMAQGLALSLFCRLSAVTGDAAWQTAAQRTFATFLLPPAAGQPWGVHVVDGLLWFDEYPHPDRLAGDRTYNGHIFSAWACGTSGR